jgi:hypothetical protein
MLPCPFCWLLLALSAEPEDGEVIEVGGEAVFPQQALLQRRQQAVLQRKVGAALAAHQVVMTPALQQLVADAAASQVGFRDQAELLQEVQGAVYGGDIDEGVLLEDPLVDLLGADVSLAIVDDIQDHQTLRRKAIPFVPERFCRGTVS